MRAKQIIKLKNGFKSTICRIYQAAIKYHYNSDKIRKRLNKYVFDTPHFKKLPRYERSYLYGVRDALDDQIMHSLVTHSYMYKGKRVMSGTKEYEAINPSDLAKHQSNLRFVWKDKPDAIFC